MVFQVPPSKASTGHDKFEFEIAGKKFAVPKAKFCTVDVLDGLDGNGAKTLALFKGETAQQQKAVGSLDREQFHELIAAWHADSEITPGEDEASES